MMWKCLTWNDSSEVESFLKAKGIKTMNETIDDLKVVRFTASKEEATELAETFPWAPIIAG